jgi:hypothetical protein
MQKTLDDTSAKLTGVETRVNSLEARFSEMGPVKMIVFGGVGFILLSVLGALLAYVIYTGAK